MADVIVHEHMAAFCFGGVHLSFKEVLLNKVTKYEPLSCSLIISADCIFGRLGNGHILIFRELQMSGKNCSVSVPLFREGTVPLLRAKCILLHCYACLFLKYRH